MSNRNPRKDEKQVYPSAESGSTGGKQGSSLDRIPVEPKLEQPAIKSLDFATSKYGDVFPTKRYRPIPADTLQAVSTSWYHDIAGFRQAGAPTLHLPDHDAAQTILEDWHPAAWRTITSETGKKPFRYPTMTLNDSDHLRIALNMGQYIIGNLVALFDAATTYHYNQAMAALSPFLPLKMGKVNNLWDEVRALWFPTELKKYWLKTGKIARAEPNFCPHMRSWVPQGDFAVGPTAYDAAASTDLAAILMTEANLDALLANIGSAIAALKGNCPADPDFAEDIIDIQFTAAALDGLRDFKNVWSQGLPDITLMAGVVNDKAFLNPYYNAAFIINDTKGLGNDEVNAFPVYGMDALYNRVPMVGWGDYKKFEDEVFTFLGAPKLYIIQDTAGLIYGEPSLVEMYGTDFRDLNGGNACQIYTREDGWVTLNTLTTDFGDGASIRTFENTSHPAMKHSFAKVRYASQLAGALEFRFLDDVETDFHIYVDPVTMGDRYARFMGKVTATPYLK